MKRILNKKKYLVFRNLVGFFEAHFILKNFLKKNNNRVNQME